jgi:hypothetical protein
MLREDLVNGDVDLLHVGRSPSMMCSGFAYGKTYCNWQTNEGIRVFSFLH